MWKFLAPLVAFVGLAIFLYAGLNRNPSEVPSPLINKTAPLFSVPQLHEEQRTFSPQDVRGKVWLFNVWASWCAACRQEHPLLVQLARRGDVPIYGLNYKDARQDAVRWLEELGNPYVVSAFDLDGKVGMDYGVYGVPETYVIDKQGVIRYKQIGPISPEVLESEILPLVRQLQGA